MNCYSRSTKLHSAFKVVKGKPKATERGKKPKMLKG
jgi:hypothetical protein